MSTETDVEKFLEKVAQGMNGSLLVEFEKDTQRGTRYAKMQNREPQNEKKEQSKYSCRDELRWQHADGGVY